jgi:Methyltransferase domain
MATLTDTATKDLLAGTTFDENVTFDYDLKTPLQNRLNLLTDLAVGKRILHIGCCDHIPLLREKLASDTWLHGRVTRVAAQCVGIDIDDEAVKRAREFSKLDNIFCGDITAESMMPEVGDTVFDYAIFGEVLEHIGNPVQFLKSFLSTYGENVRQVIITVPNALRGGNIRNVFRSRETINSDHRFFFTPYTIAKVAWDAGLSPVSIQMAHYSFGGSLKQRILNRFPLLAEDLVYTGVCRN